MSIEVTEEGTCQECGSDMEIHDSGMYKKFRWYAYRCPVCGYETSDEPDWDSMKGGHDY